MALLGLDVGHKRIGVALAEGRLAVPLTTIESAGQDADMERILDLAREYGAERVVVGLPRSLDGGIGAQARETLRFSEALSRHIAVENWDERLSTVAAERMLRESGAKSKKRKGNRDALAAAIILQAYLDGIER